MVHSWCVTIHAEWFSLLRSGLYIGSEDISIHSNLINAPIETNNIIIFIVI